MRDCFRFFGRLCGACGSREVVVGDGAIGRKHLNSMRTDGYERDRQPSQYGGQRSLGDEET